MPQPPRRLTSLVLAAGGGVAVDAASPGLSWWPLAVVGMGLLFAALRRDSARWNAVVGLVWGSGFFLPQLVWAHAAVGVIPWVALSLASAALVAAFAVAWSWARRGPLGSACGLQVATFAILWGGLEEVRAVFPFGGFPWGRVAFSQADSPLGRLAWLGGAPLVSMAVAAAGAALAIAAVRLRKLQIGWGSGYVVVAATLVLGGLLVPLDVSPESGRLRVGAVQGNVPNRGLDSFAQAREVMQNHVSGTHELLVRVDPGELDVVLWPENSTDIDPRVDGATRRAVIGAARALQAPILIGTDEHPETGGRLNVSLLWDPDAGVIDRYVKQHPAPFGEYIPMRSIARLFSDAVDRVRTDMLPGDEPGLILLPSDRLGRDVGIGTVICFEVAYDDLVRDTVVGSEVLVVQTNNATFGRTDESTQQLAMSQLRAIEHGRATVQISTVGVSAIIGPDGVVQQRTGLFTAEQMVASLPLRTSLTPATRFGDLVAWVVRGLAVLLPLTGARGGRRQR